MTSRLPLVLASILLAAAPAGADTLADRKAAVDARISSLAAEVSRLRAQEAAVRAEIAAVEERLRALASQVTAATARLAPLERELRLRRVRLGRLQALVAVRAARLRLARQEYATAVERLSERLVGLYETEEADALSLLLSTASFGELLDAMDYLRAIGNQDKRIADEVDRRRREAGIALARARAARERVRQEARVIAVRVAEERALRRQLLARRDAVAWERERRQQALQSLSRQEQAQLAEMEALQRASAELAARIRVAQAAAASPPRPSSSGFLWPVSGPITSSFGPRWGRMHEGIDVAAPAGAPVRAAAAGQVLYAGWMGGYGNLVVLDHGGGLATAYAHLSSIAVSEGATVAQGQVIGAVGSTGHSFGPHLHFEVRVGGTPVDPLGYL